LGALDPAYRCAVSMDREDTSGRQSPHVIGEGRHRGDARLPKGVYVIASGIVRKDPERLKKLQDLLDELTKLKEGEPLSLAIAVLLAELLEYGADYLPPIIYDWVKAYIEAFRTAIDNLIGILKARYFKLREDGFPPDEASNLVTSDPEVDAWLKVLWDLEHMKPSPPSVTGTPGVSTPGATPPTPSSPPSPPPVPWAKQYENCCKGLTIRSAPTEDHPGIRPGVQGRGLLVCHREDFRDAEMRD
jgi:hypothetical protein